MPKFVTLDSSGNLSLASVPVASNRIINGSMLVAQRGTSGTVTAGTAVPTATAGYPCVDRWFAYSTGANVTVSQSVAADGVTKRLQVAGAASVTQVGLGQRIEAANIYDLAGTTAILSFDYANTLGTNLTVQASYANSINTFGTIGTPTKTTISTNVLGISGTLTRYSVPINLPANAVNGVEILFLTGALTSGTVQLTNVMLEPGSVASSMDRRSYALEELLCLRYCQLVGNFDVEMNVLTTMNNLLVLPLATPMRAIPTLVTAPTFTLSNLTSAFVIAMSNNMVRFTAAVSANGYARVIANGPAVFACEIP